MNRRIKTIAASVLLLVVASLVGSCKKCDCGNCEGCNDTIPTPNPLPLIHKIANNYIIFSDTCIQLENGLRHTMTVKSLCVSDSDTSRLELDGNCIKEFYGTEEAKVTKDIENGSHRIVCYTVGTTDTVLNATFDQNGNNISWTDNADIHINH